MALCSLFARWLVRDMLRFASGVVNRISLSWFDNKAESNKFQGELPTVTVATQRPKVHVDVTAHHQTQEYAMRACTGQAAK